MKTNGNGTFIPEKYQIPVMIVGAIILVILFVWRINGGRFGDSRSPSDLARELPPEALEMRREIEKEMAREEAMMQKAIQEQNRTQRSETGISDVVIDRSGHVLPPVAPPLPAGRDVEMRTNAYMLKIRSLMAQIQDDDNYLQQQRIALQKEMVEPDFSERDPFHPPIRNSLLEADNPLALLQGLVGDSGEILDPKAYEEILSKMAEAAGSAQESEPLRLEATMTGGNRASAIINGQYLTIGDTIDGYKVIDILSRSVKLSGTIGMIEINMPREALIP